MTSGTAPAPFTTAEETDVPLDTLPQVQEASKFLAVCTWLTLLVFSFFTSGVVFGWPSLVLILNGEGIYTELCENGQLDCEARQVRLSLVYSTGMFCLLAGRFFWGLLLDWAGPRITSFLSALFIIIGSALFGISMSTGLRLYIPAYALIGMGGPGIQLANFHSSNLFPTMKRTVIASMSGIFGTSGLVFVLFHAIYKAGMRPQWIWAGFATLTMCIAFGYLVVQPRRIFQVGDGLARGKHCTLAVVRSSTETAASHASAQSPTMWGAVLHWKMVSLGIFFAISFLHLQFYLGQAESMLDKLGDEGHAYLTTFQIIGSSSIIIFYPVGLLLENGSFETSFSISLILAIAFNVISLVDSLPLQVVGFICWCVSRMILFAGFFSFIPAVVGFPRFGVTAGVLSTASAAFGLLNIGLTKVALQYSQKPVMVGFLVVLLLLFAFPALLHRSRLQEEDEVEEEDSKDGKDRV